MLVFIAFGVATIGIVMAGVVLVGVRQALLEHCVRHGQLVLMNKQTDYVDTPPLKTIFIGLPKHDALPAKELEGLCASANAAR